MSSKISVHETIRRSCLVQRFAGEEIRGHRMTIAEHHYEVVMCASHLADTIFGDDSDIKLRVVRYAMVHDLPEIFTNDISSVAKYSIPGFKELLDRAEESVVDELLPPFVHDYYALNSDPVVAIVVKTADIMAVTREIIDEQERGNVFTDGQYIPAMLERLSEKCHTSEHRDIWKRCKEILTSFSLEYAMSKK